MRRIYLIISIDFISDLGNGFISLTLLGFLVFEQTDSLWNLVWLKVVEHAPSIFFTPFAGILVDRIGAGRWLAGALICKCILSVILVFSVFPKVVIPVYFLFICASLFSTLGRLAIIPLLIDENRILSFNALNERVAIAGGILSPFLVAWTLSKIGRNAALGMAGCLFLLAACTVFMLRENTAPEASGKNCSNPGRKHLFSTFKGIFKRNGNLETCFILNGFVLLAGGILNLSLPLLFKDRFKGNISQWGFLMSLYQAGAFLSTLLIRHSATLGIRRILIVNFIVLSAAMVILGSLTPPFPLSCLMVLFGCGFTFMYVLFESLIQKNSPPFQIGKTVSALLVLRGACYLGAILGSVFVLKLLNIRSLLLGGALLLVTASMLVKARHCSYYSSLY